MKINLSIIKEKPLFFVLCPGYIQFFEILVVYEYFCLKTLNLGRFHELRKSKNIETHLVHRPGSRMRAEVQGPSLGTNMGFNFLIFRISWIPPKVFKCVCKIFVNTTKIIKKSMKYSSIKKIWAFYIEIQLWWYFGQKYNILHIFFDYWIYYLTILVVKKRCYNAQLPIVFWWMYHCKFERKQTNLDFGNFFPNL